MSVIRTTCAGYAATTCWLNAWLAPWALLFLRLWVAIAFWHAGLTKIEDPSGTLFLFTTMYHVPLLSASTAAVLATWIELVVPWLVGLGILGRISAAFLFVYNIIAFSSFPQLWPHGFWHDLFTTSAFADHKIWGMMLLMIVAWGPGALSIDALVPRGESWWRRLKSQRGSEI